MEAALVAAPKKLCVGSNGSKGTNFALGISQQRARLMCNQFRVLMTLLVTCNSWGEGVPSSLDPETRVWQLGSQSDHLQVSHLEAQG